MSEEQAAGRKIALIMGGTSGIGLATAKVLVDAGHAVVITGRDPARGQRAAEALGSAASYVRVNVADAQQVAAAVSETIARWGRLDGAVNSAALADFRPARVAEITEAEWDETLAVDLKGVWLCMKFEIEAMLAGGGGGAIVNVSSVNGLSGTPTAAAYCAAKHGIHGLSKTAAIEYAPQGIRINVVCPGAHRTPMLAGVWERLSPGDPRRAEAMMCSQIPLGRIGEPAECAQAIAWLLSGSASYVTGAILPVDGAMAAT